jgi:phosphatidylglycerol lysyltransferase
LKRWKWLVVAAGAYGAAWLSARRRARRAERLYPPTGALITVEGAPLHFVRGGEGVPVVLLHGSDGFLQDYSLTIMEQLAARYDTIALDRPAHGYSELPDGERASAPVQAAILHEALGRLGITRPILVGHSWSGLLLLYYAWAHPEDTGGLVLLAPWIYPGRIGEPLLRIVSQPWISRLVHPLFAPLKRFVVGHFLADAFYPEPVPDAYRRQAEAMWLRSAQQLAATARENSGNRRALGAFSPRRVSPDIPVQVVVGACDRVTPPDRQALRLAAQLPHVQLEMVPGAGHELHHTAPDAVLRAIDACALRAEQSGRIPAPDVAAAATSRDRARDLVMRFGWNAAAYQILNPDIEHWFTSDGEGCVGYVRRAGVRVVAGAPVCAEDRLAAVAAEFERDSSRHNVTVCYFGATDRLRSALLALPAHSEVPIGAQPGWDPASWEGILKRNRSLRAQLNRARNKGVAVTEWDRRRAATDAGLRRCFEEWNAAHASFELHFLTESVALDRLADRRLFVAERAGAPVGFLVATPIPDRRGWLVEQIVRGRAAPNGTAELLIDGLMRAVASESFAFVTLGLAPLSRRGGVAPARRLWLRLLLGWVRAHGTRFYNFEGLDSFKGKFQPDLWEPIYAISNEQRFSLSTLYGVAAAFTDGAPVAAIAHALADAVRQEIYWLRHRPAAEARVEAAEPVAPGPGGAG